MITKSETNKMITNFPQVILASSSRTREKQLRRYFKKVVIRKHLIDEEEFKSLKMKPEKIVTELAKQKAHSIKEFFPEDIIIGSDQILMCSKRLISKPVNLEDAVENLLFIRNKEHILMSSIYVIKKSKFFFKTIKKAKLFFKNVDKNDLIKYVYDNKETALSTVGSYKIEENKKFKFISIKSGDIETILGFPLKDFLRKLRK